MKVNHIPLHPTILLFSGYGRRYVHPCDACDPNLAYIISCPDLARSPTAHTYHKHVQTMEAWLCRHLPQHPHLPRRR